MLNWNLHVKGTSDVHLMAVIQFKDQFKDQNHIQFLVLITDLII